MSLISVSLFSEILKTSVDINIIAPDFTKNASPPKVMYLLHGLLGNQNSWIANSNITRYAQGKNLFIVMPGLNNTFYVNNTADIRYLDFTAYELLDYIEKTFKVSTKREDTYICGMSMGGYGAYRVALERTERFIMAISLSGALDVASMSRDGKENISSLDTTIVSTYRLDFGKDGAEQGSENDLFYLLDKKKTAKQKPELLQYCGKQDFLLGYNINFKNYIKNLDYKHSYFESDGMHDWDFWDDKIKDVIDKTTT